MNESPRYCTCCNSKLNRNAVKATICTACKDILGVVRTSPKVVRMFFGGSKPTKCSEAVHAAYNRQSEAYK